MFCVAAIYVVQRFVKDVNICFITRTPGGGGLISAPPPPSGFLQITQKRRRAAPPRLV